VKPVMSGASVSITVAVTEHSVDELTSLVNAVTHACQFSPNLVS